MYNPAEKNPENNIAFTAKEKVKDDVFRKLIVFTCCRFK